MCSWDIKKDCWCLPINRPYGKNSLRLLRCASISVSFYLTACVERRDLHHCSARLYGQNTLAPTWHNAIDLRLTLPFVYGWHELGLYSRQWHGIHQFKTGSWKRELGINMAPDGVWAGRYPGTWARIEHSRLWLWHCSIRIFGWTEDIKIKRNRFTYKVASPKL